MSRCFDWHARSQLQVTLPNGCVVAASSLPKKFPIDHFQKKGNNYFFPALRPSSTLFASTQLVLCPAFPRFLPCERVVCNPIPPEIHVQRRLSPPCRIPRRCISRIPPVATHCGSNTLLRRLSPPPQPQLCRLVFALDSMTPYPGPALPMQGPTRIRRHTMLPNPPSSAAVAAMLGGTSPPPLTPLGRRTVPAPYPSPPNSERATTMGAVDIKKKPRAMSEMASESGSMICETCGKGYKHASCLSKHKYPPTTPQLPQTAPLLAICPFRL